MKDFDYIKRKVDNGEYKTSIEYPKKPAGFNKEIYVYDENQTVKWNMEHKEELKKEYERNLELYREENHRKQVEFRDDLIEVLQAEYNFSKVQATNVYIKAWEEGHSYGLGDVIIQAQDFGDFAYDIICQIPYTV